MQGRSRPAAERWVVECAALEDRYGPRITLGSNPTLAVHARDRTSGMSLNADREVTSTARTSCVWYETRSRRSSEHPPCGSATPSSPGPGRELPGARPREATERAKATYDRSVAGDPRDRGGW